MRNVVEHLHVIRKHLQESLEVALVESVGELLCQDLEFVHAHGCVSSDLVRHTPRHTVTELYRRICPLPGGKPVKNYRIVTPLAFDDRFHEPLLQGRDQWTGRGRMR